MEEAVAARERVTAGARGSTPTIPEDDEGGSLGASFGADGAEGGGAEGGGAEGGGAEGGGAEGGGAEGGGGLSPKRSKPRPPELARAETPSWLNAAQVANPHPQPTPYSTLPLPLPLPYP